MQIPSPQIRSTQDIQANRLIFPWLRLEHRSLTCVRSSNRCECINQNGRLARDVSSRRKRKTLHRTRNPGGPIKEITSYAQNKSQNV